MSSGAAPGEALLDEWRSARLWVDCPGAPLELRQGEQGGDRRFPGRTAVVHLVTAWNPGARPLAALENACRHARLVAELEAAGTEHWAAAGYAPDEGWVEHGLALPGMRLGEACAIGLRHGQLALYAWYPDRIETVDCASAAVLVTSRYRARERLTPPA